MGMAMQCGLFESGPQRIFDDAEGGVRYFPALVPQPLAARWFDELREQVAWQAQRRPMYDRVVDVPRLVAGYRLDAPDLPPALREAQRAVVSLLPAPFNAAGLNLYRDGRDSVAPHNDKLHGLEPGQPIAVLSLGAPRRMTIRAKAPPRTAVHLELAPGSLLVMSHLSQYHYDHGVPKTRDVVGPRISLAFRVRPPQPLRSAARGG